LLCIQPPSRAQKNELGPEHIYRQYSKTIVLYTFPPLRSRVTRLAAIALAVCHRFVITATSNCNQARLACFPAPRTAGKAIEARPPLPARSKTHLRVDWPGNSRARPCLAWQLLFFLVGHHGRVSSSDAFINLNERKIHESITTLGGAVCRRRNGGDVGHG
jgi:hypothetical protein